MSGVPVFNLYQEILMDHYRNPRNRGKIEGANFCGEQKNSSCGDEVLFTGNIAHNVLSAITFEGKGCVISQATASIIGEYACNKTVDEILSFDKDFIVGMIGMQLGPARLMCALLPLMALQKGIRQFKSNS